ncbi:uncharacterized membrane protein (DUF4010 family) [Ereboglobus sp. PH5-10]|uniref:MgtC/SapB family protein n=1 Tax=Ereboglobus sp. PH5-10 TaxID=2940629 RepID=UPI0024073A34|nr:MgtC/SapB family protein [Ereboglobus sp. PH5-10]MDF9828593.1 uncharacterized membrane protein (DUF4010 family) [Ereboglobus sp. PH5-10]
MNPFLTHVLVSACLGALIGLIRQWNDQQTPEAPVDFGGVRTYSLWSLLGCLSAFVSDNYIAAMLPVVMVLVGAHLVVAHIKSASDRYPGGTTFASSMLTCLIGALVNWGYTQSAIVVAAFTMVMLGIKQPVHSITSRFTTADIRATLQFVAITGVILPLVPNRAMGPYLAFNPFSIWLMVVLISGIGFLGYVLMRMLGTKAGIAATGFLGGLASSTATTLAFSKRSKATPELATDYAFAVVLACTTMYARLAVMIGVIDQQLLLTLLVPILVMAAPGVLYAAWIWFSKRSITPPEVHPPSITNPLSLKTSIQFAALYAIAAFLIKIVTNFGWDNAVLPLAFLSGLTSTDAMSLLMANNHKDGATLLQLAAQAVIMASLANTLAKAIIAIACGSRAYVKHTASILGLMVAASVLALWLV